MKYLLVFAVVMIAFHFWRNGRRAERADEAQAQRPSSRTPAIPQEMISCAQCGLHLPRSDAVQGASGALYCGNEHRLAAER